MIHITEAPKPVQKAFRDAITAQDWLGSLSILASHGCKVRPSDSPELKVALRADPSLLQTGTLVSKGGSNGSGKVEVNASVLECERDATGYVIGDWLTDPEAIVTRYPHFSDSWKAEHQIRHLLAFGRTAEAVHVIVSNGLSIRKDDFGGELFAVLSGHLRTQSGTTGNKLVMDATHAAVEVRS